MHGVNILLQSIDFPPQFCTGLLLLVVDLLLSGGFVVAIMNQLLGTSQATHVLSVAVGMVAGFCYSGFVAALFCSDLDASPRTAIIAALARIVLFVVMLLVRIQRK